MKKKTTTAKRLSLNEKLLLELAYGGRIERRPARPFPPRYTVTIRKQEAGHVTERTADIAESRVLAMVQAGWIHGKPADKLWDVVVFSVTEKGKQKVEELCAQDAPEDEL